MRNEYIYTPFFLEHPAPLIEQLITDGGIVNIPQEQEDDQVERMSAIHVRLRDLVYKAVEEGNRPVSMSGDCCTTIGVLAGLQRAGIDPIVIWLDAHGDLNTWETSPSGFIGGMPLAMMMGYGEQSLVEAVGLRILPDKDVLLADGRDLDPGELELVSRLNLKHVTKIPDLMKFDFQNRPLYIHFDTDLLNPEDAPAMMYRTAGGPSMEAVRSMAQSLVQREQVVAVSMTVWDMEQDTNTQTQAACMSVLKALTGENE